VRRVKEMASAVDARGTESRPRAVRAAFGGGKRASGMAVPAASLASDDATVPFAGGMAGALPSSSQRQRRQGHGEAEGRANDASGA